MFPHVHAYYEGRSPRPRTKQQEDLALTVTAEMKALTVKSAFRQDEGVPQRWLGEKDYARVMKILQQQIDRQRRSFTKEELTDAYESYVNEREKQLQELQEEKWNLVTFFRELLDQPEHRSTKPLSGYDGALYETMFKAQPTKFMSRARFLTVMRLVYGFAIAEMEESVYDSGLLTLLNTLYSSFDTLREDRMDWRCFLFMVRVVHDYKDTPQEHLCWGFALFGSEGSMDLDQCGGVQLRDILDLLLSLILRHLKKTVEELFSASLNQLARKNTKVHRLLEITQLAGKPRWETRINLQQFKELLRCEPLHSLFNVSLRHGPPDCAAWTYLIEERYYHPKAVAYVWKKRRDVRNEEQAQIFINRANVRLKAKMVQMWWKFVWRRGRGRYLCQAMVIRYIARNSNVAMLRWRFVAMAPIAATTIQRYFRGYLGKVEVAVLKKLHACAITVQACYRRRMAWVRYQGYRNRRNWAATEIARHVRGVLARKLAYTKVVTFVDEQLTRIARERALLLPYPLEYHATIIQCHWRRFSHVRKYKEELEIRKKRKIVEEAMRQRELEEQRRMRVYQRSIEEFYRDLREKTLQKVVDDRRIEEVKFDMRRRKRYRKWQAQYERKKEEDKLRLVREQQKVVRFNEEWDQKRVDRAIAVRKRIFKFLTDPDNDADRAEAEAFEARIKERVPSTMKELDRRGLRLEAHQVHVVARDALIQERMEEERKIVDMERKEAAVVFEKELEEDAARKVEEEKAEFLRKRDRAATIIQVQLYRNWKARKRVREQVFRRFKKKFDPASHQHYYENTRTGAKQWNKPYVLYNYDLELRDEWFEMTSDGKVDDSIEGVRYYLNPKSINILWEKPIGTVLCSACNWNFSRKRRASDKKHFCGQCWDKAFLSNPEDKYTTPWKPVDGGWVKAAETSIELYPDQYDEDPSIAEQLQAEYEAAQIAAAEEAARLEYERQQEEERQQYAQLQLYDDYYQHDDSGSGGNYIQDAGNGGGNAALGYHDANNHASSEDYAGYIGYDQYGYDANNYYDYSQQQQQQPQALGYLPASSSSTAAASSSLLPWCQRCNAMKASKYCYQCVLYYCQVCSLSSHPRMNPVMRTHQLEKVDEEVMAQWAAAVATAGGEALVVVEGSSSNNSEVGPELSEVTLEGEEEVASLVSVVPPQESRGGWCVSYMMDR